MRGVHECIQCGAQETDEEIKSKALYCFKCMRRQMKENWRTEEESSPPPLPPVKYPKDEILRKFIETPL